MSFSEIPILDLSQARNEETKPAFLQKLQDALLNVGFLYMENTGIDQELFDRVCQEGIAFFDLPEEEKLAIEMKNQKSFLGYSRLGNEITAKKADWREQLDLSTLHPIPGPDAPLYHNLLAPNQWPSPTHLPSFRPILETYITIMGELSTFFTTLIAESLSLPPAAFNRFFDNPQQHKLKIVKYPDTAPDSSSSLSYSSQGQGQGQGVGPHKDSMLTSYLLQASPHAGLQAQNLAGEWIDCPPRRGTLVVAIGQGLEALTGGVCTSTTHRVLSPRAGQGARFSVPFFQGVGLDARFEEVDVPEAVRGVKRKRLEDMGMGRRDEVEFTFAKGRWGHLGEATLVNRVRSHGDVAERWYPELLKRVRAEDEEREKEKEKITRLESKVDGIAT